MTIDPHSAFEALIEAWQEFHAAVMETEDGEAPRVLRATDRLADAYTVYDDVLFTSFGVEAPFDTFDEDDDEDSDFDDEDDFDDDADEADDFDEFDDADYDDSFDDDFDEDDDTDEDDEDER
ncbi:MAG: hypothetical protein SPJ68_05710 [Arcanobacterium sp.]|nr:hypothetical protein [Arcanobacterium sp.]